MNEPGYRNHSFSIQGGNIVLKMNNLNLISHTNALVNTTKYTEKKIIIIIIIIT